MTKDELRRRLYAGSTLGSYFVFSHGQDCVIFKSDCFEDSKRIIYIPDISLNGLSQYVEHPIEFTNLTEYVETIEEIVGCCYTGNDFVCLCDGDIQKAKYLFDYCDWQHPSSALPEIDDD